MPGPQSMGALHRLAGNSQQLFSQSELTFPPGTAATKQTRLTQEGDQHIHKWMLRQEAMIMKLLAGQDRLEALLRDSNLHQESSASQKRSMWTRKASVLETPFARAASTPPASARSAPTLRRMQLPEGGMVRCRTALPPQLSHERQLSMMLQRLPPRLLHATVLDSHHRELMDKANMPKQSLHTPLDIDLFDPTILQSDEKTLTNALSTGSTQRDVSEADFQNEMVKTPSNCQKASANNLAKDRDSTFVKVMAEVKEPKDEVQEPKDDPDSTPASSKSRNFRITEMTRATVDSSEGDAEDNNWDASSHWRKMIRKQERKMYKGKSSSAASLDAGSREPESRLTAFVKSRIYENIGIFIVVINAIFIGWQVEHMAISHTHLSLRLPIEITFALLFTVEFLGKAYAWGREVFSRDNEDLYWNMFDFLVVLFMWLEVAMEFDVLHSDVENVSILRILRILRLVRIVKILRTLKFFRELRLMILAITQGCFCLIWVIGVLNTAFYIFGVSLTQGANDLCPSYKYEEGGREDLKSLCDNFGTLGKSILSLYAAMSGGVSWIELLAALSPLGPIYRAIFLFYTIFSIFAVSNIITGIFVDSAMQSSKNDHDTVVEAEMEKLEGYVSSIHKMFIELDQDASGTIAVREFMQVVQNDKMAAYFQALGLEITDVKMLFALMDRDRTGAIDIEEFLAGCMRLKGQARSLDLAKLALQTEWVMETLENICEGMSSASGAAHVRPTWRE